jgi:predicted nucleic acid-binding protein
MGSRFLVDTNILIYVFTQTLSEKIAEKVNKLFEDSFVISVINKIEFLGWKEATPVEHQQAIDFLSNAQVLSLDNAVIEKTIELKREMKIKIPDAIIAATCLTNGLGILTRNVKDFEGIQDLPVFNPFDEEDG